MIKKRPKLIRVTTVPISMSVLLQGQLEFVGSEFEVIGVSSGPDSLLRKISEDEKIKVRKIEMTRTISPFKDVIALLKFYFLCRNLKPLIVHTHTPKAGIVGMLGAKLANVPIRLHTVAGLPLMEAQGFKRKVLDAVEKLTYSCATKVYPNSKVLYDFIVSQNYASADKIKVIGNGSSNGINTDHFSIDNISLGVQQQLKQELGISDSDFVFVFVGRMVTDKGVNEMVSAFSELNRVDCKLLLVGPTESELDPLLPSTLEMIETNNQIIAVGYQPDVRKYFAISDALVFPSYREGFPNVVLQAGAMGLPGIVSDINGCNEIIANNHNGIIVPPKNKDAIKSAMVEILDNKSFFAALKENARNMITSRFEQKVVWDAILAEYNSLIKNPGGDV
jgi:glycosyltransferase involved in cell wall biosynthesis